MPKKLDASGWAKKPCLFLLPDEASSVCAYCEEDFSFLNWRNHCEFCGYVFHGVDCTRKCWLVAGELLRRRICVYCDRYRSTAEKLRQGEAFTCYHRGRPSEVVVCLSEETGELVLQCSARGLVEAIDLQCIDVQKGFSHAGHMSIRASASYDPLKSLSLLLRTNSGSVRTFDLKAPSAWTCQLWVDGLTAAKYVYERRLEQQEALEQCNARGEKVYEDCWFRTNYLPTRRPQARGSVSPPKLKRELPSNSALARLRNSMGDEQHTEGETESATDSSGPSSREPTPSPPLRRSSHTRISRSSSTHSSSSSYGHQSTPGLPYIRSSLSSICSCHDYEIAPSRSVSVSHRGDVVRASSPKSKCCPKCDIPCRIAMDLANL